MNGIRIENQNANRSEAKEIEVGGVFALDCSLFFSALTPIDLLERRMMAAIEEECVYVPDEVEGFSLGRVVDVGVKFLTVRMEKDGAERRVEYAKALRASPDRQKDVDDNCESLFFLFTHSSLLSGNLMFLNEGTLLHNIRSRYERKKIYVSPPSSLQSISQ